jgi:hypothetical protein
MLASKMRWRLRVRLVICIYTLMVGRHCSFLNVTVLIVNCCSCCCFHATSSLLSTLCLLLFLGRLIAYCKHKTIFATYMEFKEYLLMQKFSLLLLLLESLGVTHLPEVQKISLLPLFARLASKSNGFTGSVGELAARTICVVLCTDGVWDNWAYEDVTKFVMDSSCLSAVREGDNGCKRVTLSFMQRNILYSKRNFGGQADNATAVVMYMTAPPAFHPAVGNVGDVSGVAAAGDSTSDS